jgi:hypothetical protein
VVCTDGGGVATNGKESLCGPRKKASGALGRHGPSRCWRCGWVGHR